MCFYGIDIGQFNILNKKFDIDKENKYLNWLKCFCACLHSYRSLRQCQKN